MKVLVRGLGSIGRRHARLALEQGHTVAGVSGAPCTVCPRYDTLEDALDALRGADLVIIADATARHAQDMAALLPHAARIGRVLVEKPLTASAAELGTFVRAPMPVFVAYNLRQHPCVRRLCALLAGQHLESLHLYVGQYLPDWRPGTDYRKGYSASASRGGGVLRDLSHELDLACLLAGPWKTLTALGGHGSHLQIDSDDMFTYVGIHAACGHVACHMNYLDRTPRRRIVANTPAGTFAADLITGEVHTPDGTERFAVARDEMYARQLQAALGNDTAELCSLREGMAVVCMIDAIERASRERIWVRSGNQD